MKGYKQELSQVIAHLSDEEKVIRLQEELFLLEERYYAREVGIPKLAHVVITLLGDCSHESATYLLLSMASWHYAATVSVKEFHLFDFGKVAKREAIKALAKKTTNTSLIVDKLIKELWFFANHHEEILKTLAAICTKKDISSLLKLCSRTFSYPREEIHNMTPKIIDLIKLLWTKH